MFEDVRGDWDNGLGRGEKKIGERKEGLIKMGRDTLLELFTPAIIDGEKVYIANRDALMSKGLA